MPLLNRDFIALNVYACGVCDDIWRWNVSDSNVSVSMGVIEYDDNDFSFDLMIYVFVNPGLLACVIVESGFHRINYIVLRVRSVFNTDLRKEVDFSKSMIRDFKLFLDI